MILQLAHFQDDLADEDVMLLDTAEVRRRRYDTLSLPADLITYNNVYKVCLTASKVFFSSGRTVDW